MYLFRWSVVVSKYPCGPAVMTVWKSEQDERLKGVFKEGVRMGKWQEKWWKDEAMRRER